MANNGEAILRQLSVSGDGRGSKRWGRISAGNKNTRRIDGGRGGGGVVTKKRVMVVVDGSGRSKHAMMWALTHVANKGDMLTLLYVISPAACREGSAAADAAGLVDSLGSLCKACKPEVEVEALIIQGPRLVTVLSQVKKLEVAVLVLSQPKSSPFCCLFRSSNEEFVEQCINKADCLTMAVKKQSKGVGGYLVSTRWQKNFWLLA